LQVDLRDAYLVKGDADRLRQLFFNLLDNAIKYTPAGGSVIVEAAPAHGSACVTVTDTGIGIPSEHLSHVFERFYRVDSSRGKTPEGNGLGLAICWAIAESHAGRIAIESSSGIGTRITVTLPISTGDPTTRSPTDVDRGCRELDQCPPGKRAQWHDRAGVKGKIRF
jgi:signal transduction histidine kinase